MAHLSPSRWAFVTLLLCCFMHSVTCQNNQVERGDQMVQNLYATIRAIAFPKSPQLDEYATNVDTRFILMVPGKVLNYFDYHPGPDYTNFIQNPSKDKKFEVVPPHVMEKWFDLADVVPSANPYNGQDSGRSLANIYKSMLQEMTITNIDEQGEQVLSLYNEALDYLNEVVQHPENLTRDTTRLALYNEYKELYNDRRLEMEEKIEMKRKSLQYIDYELWFQRNYPPLLSKVESAYIRWLIFGQKELCDVYITFLDTGSSAKLLEEARIIMRSAGVASLDRTRTIYPVSFEPSDWYKYLIPKEQKPTRAELQNLLGRVQSKIALTKGLLNFYTTLAEHGMWGIYNNKLKQSQKNSTVALKRVVPRFVESELECSVQNMGIDTGPADSCEIMSNQSAVLLSALRKEAEAIAHHGSYNKRTDIIDLLNDIKSKLETKKQNILSALREVNPLLGSIVKSNPDVIESVINSRKEDQWLQFEFDSKEMEENTKFTSIRTRSELKTKSGGFFSKSSTTRIKTYSYQKFESEMDQADLKAKGKLLRVNIKRPWFKPEVFDERKLNFVSNSESGQRVLGSPGPHLTEADFINAASGGDGPDDFIYRLPEYVTSFLLAKDIELEISSKSQNLYRTFMKETSLNRHTTELNLIIFKASATVESYSSSSTEVTRVHRTADGFKLKIPGAQLIGYYTRVLPKFPLS